MLINTLSRRKMFSSFLAVLTATIGFTSSSCAAPRWPAGGGYPLRSAAGGYELQVLMDGAQAPAVLHAGETYVQGQIGARYTLRVVNHTGRRIEAVVSVDGRDAIDGKTADARNKRGYLVPAWGAVDIDGWRLSNSNVAAFRFSSVADSYAARTGNAREVGVIGVAVFPERPTPRPRPIYAPPSYPYHQPPYRDWRDDARSLGAAPSSDGESRDRKGEIADNLLESAPAERKSKAAEAPAAGRAAPAPSSRAAADALAERGPPAHRRPGLGTEFGESLHAPVHQVDFVRAHATRPSVVLGARYNDREGLLALGIDVEGTYVGPDDLAWRQTATPFPASDSRYATPPAGWRQGCCVSY